jgi:hypothetical protein
VVQLLVGLELELGEPALVVDRHGGVVQHRALNVVDRDVLAEDRPRTRVRFFDRRAREADRTRTTSPSATKYTA